MNGMGWMIIGGLLGMLLLSSGCPRQQTQQQNSPAAGGEVPAVTALGSPDADINPDAKPVIPPEWPLDQLPMYPAAELTSSHYNLGGPDSGCVLTLTTTDPGGAVLDFYVEHAEAAGYQRESLVSASESGAAYFKGENGYFNAGYRIENGETLVTLIVMFPVNTEENIAFAGSGQLPKNFPIDILPLFPGASVLEAHNMPMDNMLMMHVFDTPIDDVLDFYAAYYKERDFKILKKDKPSKTYYNYVFEGPEGGVVLNLTQENDGSASIDMIYGRR